MELQNYSFVISCSDDCRLPALPSQRPAFSAVSCYRGGLRRADGRFHTIYSGLDPQDHAPMPNPVITRFAPSPTGFLHIGGARTALFNWLYARHAGGKMLLRIEDTDRERSTDAAIAAILDGLSWLGLEWDGEAISQFSRSARHRDVAQQLLATGKAYYCYASPEELAEMREAARREGRSKLYDGRWRDRDPAEAPPGV